MLHCQKYFEDQFLLNLKKFESLIEPVLTIIIGIILAVIMLAIMEPNFNLGNIL
jgi:type II secretory pathway component PulF